MDRLNEKVLGQVRERLEVVSRSLEGIAALFTQCMRDPCFEGDEIYGIGVVLRKLAGEMKELEGILDCEGGE